MTINPLKKNKINLSDYDFQKDIENRLLMSDLSVFELDILTEIIHGSLKTTTHQIADAMGVELEQLTTSLTKLQDLKLYDMDKEHILVNKEARKYYEFQITKFDDDFRCDLEFLRKLLSKVPIHVLPVWYTISRTSDDIFSSIIEKYFHTPKIYKRYLDEIAFDEPVLNEIMNAVMGAPDFKITAKEMIAKHGLSREKFEEYMLLLEFNLVCYLSYNQHDDHWVEVITPLHEWRQFLRYLRDSSPKAIQDKSSLEKTHPHDFGFTQDLCALLAEATASPIPLTKDTGSWSIPTPIVEKVFSHVPEATLKDGYASSLINKLDQLKLIEIENEILYPRKIASAWMDKHLQEQAMAIYRYSTARAKTAPGGHIDRDLRDIEKCLKRVVNIGWIYLDDFTHACTAPIGSNQPVALVKKGKRWKYEIPVYSSKDRESIKSYIFETLFHAGIVSTGMHAGKPCFCVTPFGRMTLD